VGGVAFSKDARRGCCQNLAPFGPTRSAPVVFGAGAVVGGLGEMIGLGGAEFRLPLLIGLFGFAALSAVILNKALSLVVVLVALPARLVAVPAAEVAARRPVAVNRLAGRLLGAWAGAAWAVRVRTSILYKVLAALMVLMAAALVVTHTTALGTLALPALGPGALRGRGRFRHRGVAVIMASPGASC
jgi:uncharacterized membrane protein YfcA